MRRIIAIAATCALLAAGATLAGCERAAERVTKELVESQTGVSVDEKDERVTITGEDGETVEFGADTELPDGFPSEMPVYDGAIEASSRFASDGRTTYSVTLTTADDVTAVKSWYETELGSNGWTETETTEIASDDSEMVYIGTTKGDMEGSVTIQQDAGDDTYVHIVLVTAE